MKSQKANDIRVSRLAHKYVVSKLLEDRVIEDDPRVVNPVPEYLYYATGDCTEIKKIKKSKWINFACDKILLSADRIEAGVFAELSTNKSSSIAVYKIKTSALNIGKLKANSKVTPWFDGGQWWGATCYEYSDAIYTANVIDSYIIWRTDKVNDEF